MVDQSAPDSSTNSGNRGAKRYNLRDWHNTAKSSYAASVGNKLKEKRSKLTSDAIAKVDCTDESKALPSAGDDDSDSLSLASSDEVIVFPGRDASAVLLADAHTYKREAGKYHGMTLGSFTDLGLDNSKPFSNSVFDTSSIFGSSTTTVKASTDNTHDASAHGLAATESGSIFGPANVAITAASMRDMSRPIVFPAQFIPTTAAPSGSDAIANNESTTSAPELLQQEFVTPLPTSIPGEQDGANIDEFTLRSDLEQLSLREEAFTIAADAPVLNGPASASTRQGEPSGHQPSVTINTPQEHRPVTPAAQMTVALVDHPEQAVQPYTGLLIDHPSSGPSTTSVTATPEWDSDLRITPWVSRSKPGIGWSTPRSTRKQMTPTFHLSAREREEVQRQFYEQEAASMSTPRSIAHSPASRQPSSRRHQQATSSATEQQPPRMIMSATAQDEQTTTTRHDAALVEPVSSFYTTIPSTAAAVTTNVSDDPFVVGNVVHHQVADVVSADTQGNRNKDVHTFRKAEVAVQSQDTEVVGASTEAPRAEEMEISGNEDAISHQAPEVIEASAEANGAEHLVIDSKDDVHTAQQAAEVAEASIEADPGSHPAADADQDVHVELQAAEVIKAPAGEAYHDEGTGSHGHAVNGIVHPAPHVVEVLIGPHLAPVDNNDDSISSTGAVFEEGLGSDEDEEDEDDDEDEDNSFEDESELSDADSESVEYSDTLLRRARRAQESADRAYALSLANDEEKQTGFKQKFAFGIDGALDDDESTVVSKEEQEVEMNMKKLLKHVLEDGDESVNSEGEPMDSEGESVNSEAMYDAEDITAQQMADAYHSGHAFRFTASGKLLPMTKAYRTFVDAEDLYEPSIGSKPYNKKTFLKGLTAKLPKDLVEHFESQTKKERKKRGEKRKIKEDELQRAEQLAMKNKGGGVSKSYKSRVNKAKRLDEQGTLDHTRIKNASIGNIKKWMRTIRNGKYHTLLLPPLNGARFGIVTNFADSLGLECVVLSMRNDNFNVFVRRAAHHKAKHEKGFTTKANSAARIPEGAIVGQDAAPLGEENKGRVMLEKLGWSPGMTVGSGSGTALSEPVQAVVKNSKRGL